MHQLTEFLLKSTNLPFEWGKCDCCLWVSDWVKFARGVDPANSLRGSYSDKYQADIVIALRGGLFEICTNAAFEFGLKPTLIAKVGDVAIIKTKLGEALAIRTPLGWAQKAKFGFTVNKNITPIHIWEVL